VQIERRTVASAQARHLRPDNEHRLTQLTRTQPETIAVGCPFCMTMLEDAVKARSLEETLRVRDLSELMAEAVDPDPDTEEAKRSR
jgi:Fe-S oxidoreductase